MCGSIPLFVSGTLLIGGLFVAAGRPNLTRADQAFTFLKEGVAPDERRALLIGTALWQASVSEPAAKSMNRIRVTRVGEAWITEACDPRSGVDLLDGCAYIVFDSRDGGLFMASMINPPSKEMVLAGLRRHRDPGASKSPKGR